MNKEESQDNSLCEACGILVGEELTPEAYETLWDAIPALRVAQEAGETTHCPECGRQLTFSEEGGG